MKKGRPRKKKIINSQVRAEQFNPWGRPEMADETTLAMEEFEALRLADYLNMPQRVAAGLMGISQQSFSRIVRTARKKLSGAIVNAERICIDGGDFVSKRALDIANKLKCRKEPAAKTGAG